MLLGEAAFEGSSFSFFALTILKLFPFPLRKSGRSQDRGFSMEGRD